MEECPKPQCVPCQKAPLTYPYHPRCHNTISQSLIGQEVLWVEWLLRLAQAMSSVPVQKRSATSRSLISYFHINFERIIGTVSPNTPLSLMLLRLKCLPPVLQEQIFSFMLESPGGYVLFYEQALNVLNKLRSWPDKRHRRISCNGALFARWDMFRQRYYLAGLYDEQVEGSIPIVAQGSEWDRVIIQSDTFGITDVAFKATDSAQDGANPIGYTQVIRRPRFSPNRLWIMTEVFITPL